MRKINEVEIEKVYQFVLEYQHLNNKSPSLAKIAKALNFSSSRIAQIFVDRLVERGKLDKDVDGKIEMCNSHGFPVLTEVHCGDSDFEEKIFGYLDKPSTLFGAGQYCAFKCSGDSMINAGIDDGDIVITRLQEHAESGQIAVLFVGGSFLLKRFIKEGNNVILRSENENYEDIFVEGYAIHGVAVRVIKKIK